MATSSNLSTIIRYYAEKTNSPFIDFREFCAYIKKYSEHHVEENAELVKYLGNPQDTVYAELQGLSEKHLATLITNNNKKTIVSIAYFAHKFGQQYLDILKNNSTLYPTVADLPKQFPLQILERKNANEYISSIIDKEGAKNPHLYIIEFSNDIPPLLLPGNVSVKNLLETAQQKIRKILKKEEYHDYFLKKLRSTNPTKEISIRNFYSSFVDSGTYNYTEFNDGDDYYIWNQTLYYVRKDFEKIQDKTQEDVNILQAGQILEIHSSYLKEKFQTEQKRQEALKELETCLSKPPYFFSVNQILKFQDTNGRLLYGRYTEDDLKNFLQTRTTEGDPNELPPLLIFKVASGTRYYVYKKFVPQVVVRLCNEAHISIAKEIEEDWYNHLYDYEHIPAMNNLNAFEELLHEMVEVHSPVLHALLNANFMTLLAFEKTDDASSDFQLFVNGHLMSYSELLMLQNSKLLSNAKSRLPFYYSIPIISWIISLFSGRKKKKNNKNKKQHNLVMTTEENKAPERKMTKQEAFAQKATDIAKELIPEGSTVDRELDYLIKQWNKMISKEAYNNLIEDVNSLIRDYTRRVLKTLTVSTFSRDRIEGLAKTLVNTPNMKKINEEKALTEYVTLYILRLISNV